MARRRIARRVPRRKVSEYTREYALNSQNPGKRRNYTVRDSQTYVEPTLFQMTGMFRQQTEQGRSRTFGFGTFGA